LKAHEYLPKDATGKTEQIFGKFTVSELSKDERQSAGFVVRKMKISLNDNPEKSKQFVHFHYTGWPDHGVPETSSIVQFMKE